MLTTPCHSNVTTGKYNRIVNTWPHCPPHTFTITDLSEADLLSHRKDNRGHQKEKKNDKEKGGSASDDRETRRPSEQNGVDGCDENPRGVWCLASWRNQSPVFPRPLARGWEEFLFSWSLLRSYCLWYLLMLLYSFYFLYFFNPFYRVIELVLCWILHLWRVSSSLSNYFILI